MKYLSRAARVSKAGNERESIRASQEPGIITSANELMNQARTRSTSSSVGLMEHFFELAPHESAVQNAFRRFQDAQIGLEEEPVDEAWRTDVKSSLSLLFGE